MSIVFKVLRVMPVVGWLFLIASAPDVLRRKGYILGLLSLTLDMIPVICLIKAGIEVFNGDIIPNKFETQSQPHFEPAS